MNHKPITIHKDTGLQIAAEILLDNNISCFTVVSPEGGFKGIVTWKDILGKKQGHKLVGPCQLD